MLKPADLPGALPVFPLPGALLLPPGTFGFLQYRIRAPKGYLRPVKQCPKLWYYVNAVIMSKIFPTISLLYKFEVSDLSIKDLFYVRYQAKACQKDRSQVR